MKTLVALMAGATGFVLGSRMGRAPYEALEAKTRKFAHRSDVKNATAKASGALHDAAKMGAHAAHECADSVVDRVGHLADAGH